MRKGIMSNEQTYQIEWIHLWIQYKPSSPQGNAASLLLPRDPIAAYLLVIGPSTILMPSWRLPVPEFDQVKFMESKRRKTCNIL